MPTAAQVAAPGYSGNSRSECQNFTMVRNGTYERCDERVQLRK